MAKSRREEKLVIHCWFGSTQADRVAAEVVRRRHVHTSLDNSSHFAHTQIVRDHISGDWDLNSRQDGPH
jgi:hypothetical protein